MQFSLGVVRGAPDHRGGRSGRHGGRTHVMLGQTQCNYAATGEHCPARMFTFEGGGTLDQPQLQGIPTTRAKTVPGIRSDINCVNYH